MTRGFLLALLLPAMLAAKSPPASQPATQPEPRQARLDINIDFRNEAHVDSDVFYAVFEQVYREVHPNSPPLPLDLYEMPWTEFRIGGGILGSTRLYCYLSGSEELLDGVYSHLRKLADDRAAMPDEQAQAKLKEIEPKLAAVQQQISDLVTLQAARREVRGGFAVEKMKSLEMERERLTMDLAAKKARADAVREQMEKISKQIDEKLQNDPVTVQLTKVVDAKKKELEQLRTMISAGTASLAEVLRADGAVSEAEARLGERADAVRQATNGELLNRLATEVAMLAIDEAEMRTRLQLIDKQLPPEDFNTLDEARLKELASEYLARSSATTRSEHSHSEVSPLQWELQARERALSLAKLALVIREVRVVESP